MSSTTAVRQPTDQQLEGRSEALQHEARTRAHGVDHHQASSRAVSPSSVRRCTHSHQSPQNHLDKVLILFFDVKL